MLLMDYGLNGTMLHEQEGTTLLVPENTSTVHSLWAESNLTAEAAHVETMNRVGHGIIIPIIAAIGMVLNLLNLLVLCNGKLGESSYTYLTALACADFGSLLAFFINGIGRGNFPDEYEWRIFEAYIYFPCGLITTTTGAMLTVTVSLERYIFIYKPIKAKRWCKQRMARKITAIVWLTAIVINIPRFFVFAVDRERGKLIYTTFGQSEIQTCLSWFYFITVSCGCGIALIVFNILLIRGIHKTNIKKRALCSSSARAMLQQRQDEMRLTRTLISIVTVYLIGEIPSALLSRILVVALIGRGDPAIVSTFGYQVASLVATILIVCQLSLNFVVYCVFNKTFWATFKQQLCPCVQPRVRVSVNGHYPLTTEQDHGNLSTGIHCSSSVDAMEMCANQGSTQN